MPKKAAISTPYKGLVLPGMTADDTAKLVAGLYKKALQLMRPRHWEVSDMVSIGLLRAIESLDAWREDGGASRLTYCFRAALSEMLEQSRENMGAARIPYDTARKGEYTAYAVSLDDVPLATPFASPEEAMAAKELHAAIDGLPQKEKEVMLRILSDDSMQSWATEQGVTRERARQRKQAAFAQLQVSLSSRPSRRYSRSGLRPQA